MLSIQNLVVEADKKKILNSVSLKIKPGEIHALMGPNGSGKSTLALALAGHPRYQITFGKIKLDGKDITSLTPDKRAKLGLFLAMQYPTAIPGVSVANFLRTSLKNLKGNIKPPEFVKTLKSKMGDLKIDESFASRGINDGFSGGEKKKMEILQLSILEQKYAILDETDSGLDVDALKIIANSILNYSSSEPVRQAQDKLRESRSNVIPAKAGIRSSIKSRMTLGSRQARTVKKKPGILLITHYQRILRYIKPDYVHILIDGKIVKSGDHKLAEEIEEKGYQTV